MSSHSTSQSPQLGFAPPAPVSDPDSDGEAFMSLFGDISQTAPSSDAEEPDSVSSGQERPQGLRNRKTRNREKQRARRALGRQQKRDEAAAVVEAAAAAEEHEVLPDEEIGQGIAAAKPKRHRPTQVERSMAFFMTMYDWSGFFIQSEHWLPLLRAGPGAKQLDRETAQAITRTVRQCLLSGDNGSSSSDMAGKTTARAAHPRLVFASTDELERFAGLKAREAAYIEKQLAAAPHLQDAAWRLYHGELERLSSATPPEITTLALGGPAHFLTRIILPCLRAQVSYLEAKLKKIRALEDRQRELHRRCERQDELRRRVQSLRRSQAFILPICPVWKEIETEIAALEKEMMHPWDLGGLRERRDTAARVHREELAKV